LKLLQSNYIHTLFRDMHSKTMALPNSHTSTALGLTRGWCRSMFDSFTTAQPCRAQGNCVAEDTSAFALLNHWRPRRMGHRGHIVGCHATRRFSRYNLKRPYLFLPAS